MYEGYINAAKETLSKNVKIVIDRFHVAKNYHKGVEFIKEARIKEIKTELSDEEYKN